MSRMYHLVAINEKSGAKTYLTKHPMSHAECVTMKGKFSHHPLRRVQLEEVSRLSKETIIKTREHFAESAIGCIREVEDGRVALPSHTNMASYFAWNAERAEEYRAGKWDHTFAFLQHAHWIQTGEMVALLP